MRHMTDKKPNTRPEKAEYAICWDAGFIAGKAEAFEQGKLAGKKEQLDDFLEAVEKYCMDGDGMLEWMKHRSLLKSKWLKSQLSRGEHSANRGSAERIGGAGQPIPPSSPTQKVSNEDIATCQKASRNPESLPDWAENYLSDGKKWNKEHEKKKEGSE